MEHLDPAALAAFQDGGLATPARESAEAHLAECAVCRDRLGAQVRAAGGREAAGQEAPRGVTRAIRSDRGVRRELLAAAVLGALLVGGGLWWAADRAATERAAPPPERASAPPARESAPPASPSPAEEELAGTRQRSEPAAPAAEPSREEGVEPELLALRGGARVVHGKSFRLRGDEWVDDAWRAPLGRPPIPIVRGTDAWRAALAERPALARYAEVGPRVLVVLDSLAFRILPAP